MSSGNGAGPLVPTFHGFVSNSMDGLILFEACLSGKLHHVPRRPHDRERSQLIKSGSIFIYEENASGIKRWTDGVAWSPSRILGNFLIYRELEKPFPPGEKKRAMKRKRTSMPGEPYPRRDSEENENIDIQTPLTPPTPSNAGGDVKSELPANEQEKDMERHLIGSLVDSYGFRPDGLVKKTMSISINGVSHHMVSYYKVDDVKNQLLPNPRTDPRLHGVHPRPELYMKQNFRAPVEETDQYTIDGHMHAPLVYSSMGATPYGVRAGQYFGHQYPIMYGAPASSGPGMYGNASGTAWQGQPVHQGAIPYQPAHQSYGSPNYASYYKPGESTPTSAVKTEHSQAGSQPVSYPPSYSSSYPAMQRSSSQSTPSMMQSSYQTSVQQSPSTYGSMSAPSSRPPYAPASINTSTTNEQQSQGYSTSATQSYLVRSPTQGYGLQNAQHSAVTQSPHSSVKSPRTVVAPGTPATSLAGDPNAQLHSSQVPYRSSTAYNLPPTSHTPHSGSDINGLGISSSNPYGAPAHSGQSYSYASSNQAFRPVGEVASASQGASSYAQ